MKWSESILRPEKRNHGGILLPHFKNTAESETVVMPPPERVYIPLSQHIGAPCTPVVKKGDAVFVGTLIGEAPSFVLEPPEATELAAASERLDAVAAAVWQLSRAEARVLVTAGQVFVNGLAAQKADAPLQVGELVSVRGKGRFRYEGPVRQTRSGRLRVSVRIY